MGIYHSRLHVAVAEELLDSAYVIICLQQVGRKGVAEGIFAAEIKVIAATSFNPHDKR